MIYRRLYQALDLNAIGLAEKSDMNDFAVKYADEILPP